jgi:TIR domain
MMEKQFDIMISYSHKDKVLCKQIYEELIKSGYHVWIDFEQMHGNLMDAMSQAIERSHTVIICMSEEYRKSNYCRAESHYAFQRQRKIFL